MLTDLVLHLTLSRPVKGFCFAYPLEAAGSAKDRAASVAAGAAGVAGSARESVGGWMDKISEKAADVRTAIGDQIFEDQEVEVLVLPTGSETTDFVSYLDLTKTLETLAGGKLVRLSLSTSMTHPFQRG